MADRVIVIGGGIVGLSAAWQLKKRGWTVTLVTDRATGSGASRVNAGWLIPGHSDPVPSPGLVATSMKWMRSSASPLYIQPRPSLELARWLTHFWRHCNETCYWQGVEALGQLGADTWDRFDEMRADGMTFEEHRDGILYVFQNPADLNREVEHFARFANPGFAFQGPIVGDDLRQMEPALSQKIHGGIWLTQERSVRPGAVTAALTDWVTNNGVDVRTGVKVEGLTIANDRVTDVVFDKGRMETDAVLIAAGAWSPQIAKYAKRRIPIQGAKATHSTTPHRRSTYAIQSRSSTTGMSSPRSTV